MTSRDAARPEQQSQQEAAKVEVAFYESRLSVRSADNEMKERETFESDACGLRIPEAFRSDE